MDLPDLTSISPVDEYASAAPPAECGHGPQPGVVQFRDFVLENLGGGDSGIVRACGVGAKMSHHHEGRAWDWRVSAEDPADIHRVEELFDWLFRPDGEGNEHANLRRSGIGYLIWDGKIWSARSKQWRPYSGHPHRDHVHISFGWPAARQQTSLYRWLNGQLPVPAPGPVPSERGAPWVPMAATVAGIGLGYLALRAYQRVA